MTEGGHEGQAADHAAFVLVGYDGSRDAAGAIAVGASLLPGVVARVVTVWAPPGGDAVLRRRVMRKARTADELSALMAQEAVAAAEQIAEDGAALARARGWAAEPSTRKGYGDAGIVLAHLAGELHPEAVVVGSRGLTGTAAAMGSVSDLVVHHCPVPVLVVPLLLSGERAAAATGPVLVGHDGSEGAERARAAAAALLPGREQVLVHVTPAAGATEPAPPDTVALAAHGWGGQGVAASLDAEASARDAALLVVGSRGRSTLRELVLGSTAMAVLHHAHRPVLVVPTPRG
jgi:nucleotide-binding universal stress UspA family protein